MPPRLIDIIDYRIILREEKEFFLLYNGDNGGLIKISKKIFEENLFVITTKHGELINWLFSYDFLMCKNSSAKKNLSSKKYSQEDGFFNLRSQRSPFSVLWAITPRCNLRCLYCFPDVYSQVNRVADIPPEKFFHVADQIIKAKVFKVILSGGECLLMPNVWEIAEIFRSAGITVALLSNGDLVSKQVAERAKELKLIFGISVDAPTEEINSITRGNGSLKKSLNALKLLLQHDVPVSAMVTVTRYNFDYIHLLVTQLAKLGITSVTLQDLRPFGNREVYDRTRLTATQEQNLKEVIQCIRINYPNIKFDTTELFLFSKKKDNEFVMQCPAGEHFAYIDVHGDLYPCTSLPDFKLGNLFNGDSLVESWRYSDAIFALRRLKRTPLSDLQDCACCVNKPTCDGGCRGDAKFYHGNFYSRPSRCPQDIGNQL